MAHSRLSGYTRRVLIAAGAVMGIVGAVYFLWELARVFLLISAGVLFAVFVGGLATKLAERSPLPRARRPSRWCSKCSRPSGTRTFFARAFRYVPERDLYRISQSCVV